jgi:hypothetical protein
MNQISTILRDQFGILPKRRAIGYTTQVQWIGRVQLHRACEAILGTIGDDLSVRPSVSKVLFTVSYRASFRMVHFIGS